MPTLSHFFIILSILTCIHPHISAINSCLWLLDLTNIKNSCQIPQQNIQQFPNVSVMTNPTHWGPFRTLNKGWPCTILGINHAILAEIYKGAFLIFWEFQIQAFVPKRKKITKNFKKTNSLCQPYIISDWKARQDRVHAILKH